MYKGDRSRKENLVEYGFRLPSALDNRPLRFDEFEKVVRQTIFVSATPADTSAAPGAGGGAGGAPDRPDRPRSRVRPAATQVDDLLSEINERVQGRARAGHDAHQAHGRGPDRVPREHGVKVRYLHSDIDTWSAWRSSATCGWAVRRARRDQPVREGLDLPEVSLVAILDADKEGFCAPSGR
jgi:excinuclease ABC subunit B